MNETTFAAYRLARHDAAELDRTNEIARSRAERAATTPEPAHRAWLARLARSVRVRHTRRGARVAPVG